MILLMVWKNISLLQLRCAFEHNKNVIPIFDQHFEFPDRENDIPQVWIFLIRANHFSKIAPLSKFALRLNFVEEVAVNSKFKLQDIRNITKYNGVRWVHDYQEACMDKVERFIKGELGRVPSINQVPTVFHSIGKWNENYHCQGRKFDWNEWRNKQICVKKSINHEKVVVSFRLRRRHRREKCPPDGDPLCDRRARAVESSPLIEDSWTPHRHPIVSDY